MDVRYPNEGMPKFPTKMPAWLIPAIIGLLILSGAGTFVYEVGPDQVGVIQRFGKYIRTTNPGLHFKLPFGIETVKTVRVTHVFKEEFGFRTVMSGVRSTYASEREFRSGSGDPLLDESLMLTGDLNVAVVEWIVQYTIKDPVAFAFRVRDPRETIRNMSEAMMRLVIGDHTINEVLTSGRVNIQTEMEKHLQEVLDSYGSGIAIRNVILQDVTPPNEVKPSFNEVNEARQEKEKVINQAWEEYNKVIPRASGQAEQQIREAEGYALERINRAQGEAKSFNLTWEAYKTAPDVTRQRLYLEMVEKLYPLLKDKLILDDSQKGLLPFLNLKPDQKNEEAVS